MEDFQPGFQNDFDARFRSALDRAEPKADLERLQCRVESKIADRASAAPLWKRFLCIFALTKTDVAAAGLAVALSILAFCILSPHKVQGAYTGNIQIYDPFRFAWKECASSQFPENKLVRVETSECIITLNDGSELCLQPGSLIRLEERNGTALKIFRGRLDADIRPQPAGKSFRVSTPTDWNLTVIGTRFTVIVKEEQ